MKGIVKCYYVWQLPYSGWHGTMQYLISMKKQKVLVAKLNQQALELLIELIVNLEIFTCIYRQKQCRIHKS